MKNVKAGGINVLGVICWYGAWLAAAHPVGAQLSGDLWNVFDESFTSPGAAWVERDQQPGRILALGEQADGRVLVGGVFDQFGVSRPGLVRLELDGRVDASFAPELSSDAGVVTVRSIVVRDGGRILIAGNFTRVNGVERRGLARLEPAGGLDRSFDPGAGPGLTVGGLGVPAVRWMLPGPGSSLYVGGWFDRFNGHPRPGVARLLSDGTVDPAFVPALEPGAGYNVAALTPDGGVLLGGGPNLEAGYELVKLGSDGSRAPGFQPEVGIAGSLGAGPAVRALAVDNDGKIYVGGDFSAVGGVERHRLARLLPDGTLDSAFDPAELPDNGQGGGAVTWLGFDAAGRLWVAGSSGDPLGVAKYYFGIGADRGAVGANGRWLIRELENATPGLEGGLVLHDGRILARGHVGQRDATSQRPGLARLLGAFEGGLVQWESALGTVSERETSVVVRLVRAGNLEAPASVEYRTRNGQAEAGSDYVAASGVISFAPGETAKDVVIRLLPDGLREEREMFTVELVAGAGGTPVVIMGRPREVRIEDDDSGFEFDAIETLVAREGAPVVALKVQRTTDRADAASVEYRVTSYGAVLGDDFLQLGSGRLEFAAGELEKTIRFQLVDDAVAERNEEFGVVLHEPSAGASLGRFTQRRVLIEDNESEFNFLMPAGNPGEPLFFNELAAAPQAVVQRIGDLSRATSVRVVSVQSGGAVAGRDFIEISEVLEFAEGVATRSVPLRLLDNRILDAAPDSRDFTLVLRDPQGGSVVGPWGERRVMIGDNETGFVTIGGGGDNVVVNEGIGTRSVVVRRGFDSPMPVSVRIRWIEEGARLGQDFTWNGGDRLIFEPGQMTNRVDVTIIDDAEFESEERFGFELVAIEPGTRVDWPNSYYWAIRDDEPGFYLSGNGTTIEGGQPVIVRVSRNRGLDRAMTVHVSTQDATARAGVDYVPLQTTLHFAAGEASRTVNIEVLDDAEPEADEQFAVVLSHPALGGGIVEPSRLTVNIRDNENLMSLAGGSSTFRESQGSAVVTVVRSGALDREAQVELVVAAGTALEGVDYLPFTSIVDFAPGEARKTVAIPLVNDDVPEQNEWFQLRLRNASAGAAVGNGPSEIWLNVYDDDVPPSVIEFDPANTEVNELDGRVRIRVKRSTGWGWANVQVVLRPGTATTGTDFLSPDVSNVYTLGFGAGQVVADFYVPLVEDSIVEGDESFQAILRGPSSDPNMNLARLGEQTTLTITVHDAGQVVEFSAPSVAVSETASKAEVTVRRRGDVSGTSRVRWRTEARGSAGDADFEPGGGVIEFAAGMREAKIEVAIRDDFLAEGEERFTLGLESPESGATLGRQSQAIVIILDDEQVIGTEPGFWRGISGELDRPPDVAGHVVGADDSVLFIGSFTLRGETVPRRVLRVTADGRVDRAYQDGLARLGSQVWPGLVRILSDGRALVAAQWYEPHGPSHWGVVRLERDGRFDQGFGVGVEFDSGSSWSQLRALEVQPDGRILVGGEFLRVGGLARRGIVRLTADGQVDPTFDPGNGPLRPVADNLGDTNRYTAVAVLALDPVGRIYVGGEFLSFAGEPRLGLARLLNDGRLDPGFDAGSRFAVIDPNFSRTNAAVSSLAVQGDGQVLVTGSLVSPDAVLAQGVLRLDGTGAVDPGWDAGIEPGGGPIRVALTRDGRVWLAGSFMATRGGLRRGVALLRPDGSVDPAFAGWPPGLDATDMISLLSDGRLVGSGWRGDGGRSFSFELLQTVWAREDASRVEFVESSVRVSERAGIGTLVLQRAGNSAKAIEVGYHASAGTAVGGLDYQDGTGTAVLDPGVNRKEITVPWVLDDGLVEGSESFRIHLDSLSPGIEIGRLDTMTMEILDDELAVKVDLGFAPEIEGRVSKAIGLEGGRLLILGEFQRVGGMLRRGIARLLPDGSVDPTFDAKLGLDADTDCCLAVRAAAVSSDGSMVIAGTFTLVGGQTRRGLARLHADGSLDARFAVAWGDDWNWLTTLALQPDGGVVVAGWGPRMLRFNADGSRDSQFAGGKESPSDVQRLWALPDGRLIVFGHFETWAGTERYRIVRLQADGTLDPDFGIPPSAGYQLRIEKAEAVQPDGSILVSAYGADETGTLLKIRPDGLVDAAFRPDLRSLNLYAGDMTALAGPDGFVWVAGRSNVSESDSPESVGWLARLRADGSRDTGFQPVRVNLLPGSPWGFGFQFNLGLSPADAEGVWITPVNRVDSLPVGPVARVVPALAGARFIGFALDRDLALEGVEPLSIQIRRYGDTTAPATVILRPAADSPAQPGRDYFLEPTIVRFEPLEASRVVKIPLADNSERGGDTRMTLELVEPSSGVMVGRRRMAVTLFDDEARSALDLGFRPGLELMAGNYGSPSVDRVRPTTDAKFELWGNFQFVQGLRREGYARLFPDGRLDTNAPVFAPNWPQYNGDAAVLPDGRRFEARDSGLVLIYPDGRTAPDFLARVSAGGWSVRAIAHAGADKFILGGSFASVGGMSSAGVARLLPDGAFDPTFKIGRGIRHASGSLGEVRWVHVLPDGRIVIAGLFGMVDGVPRPNLARLQSNGAIDPSFPSGTGARFVDANITAIAVAHDGSVFVAGYLPGFQKGSTSTILKIGPDGALDRILDIASGPKAKDVSGQTWDGTIRNLTLDAAGGLWVGGEFAEFAGVPLPGLVRMRPEATGAADVRLTATRTDVDGRVRVRAHGLAGWSYTLEASADLRTWMAGETKAADPNAVEFDLGVPGPGGASQQFYRVRATPAR